DTPRRTPNERQHRAVALPGMRRRDARQVPAHPPGAVRGRVGVVRRGRRAGHSPLHRGGHPMTDWTDADVELVARALAAEDVHWGYDHGFEMSIADGKPTEETAAFAHAALSALAAAGRDYT